MLLLEVDFPSALLPSAGWHGSWCVVVGGLVGKEAWYWRWDKAVVDIETSAGEGAGAGKVDHSFGTVVEEGQGDTQHKVPAV